MKLIGTLQGVSALRFSIEEVIPKTGLQPQKLMALLRTTYKVTPAPTISTGQMQQDPTLPPMTFVNGQFTEGENSFSVSQIIISSLGIMIVSQTTDSADKILEHVCALLDESLGFTIRTASTKQFHISTVVVKFDREFEMAIEPLKNICNIIKGTTRHEGDFAIKRLAFGGPGDPGAVVTIENIDKADFILERRVSAPFSENRWFSTAGVQTTAHLAALEQIEAAIPA